MCRFLKDELFDRKAQGLKHVYPPYEKCIFPLLRAVRKIDKNSSQKKDWLGINTAPD